MKKNFLCFTFSFFIFFLLDGPVQAEDVSYSYQPSNHAEDLRGYADLVRAYGDYARMLAEARLAIARSELVEAQAAHEWQEVRRLRLLYDRMQRELKALAREENQRGQMIKEIQTLSRRLKVLTIGRTSDTIFRAFRTLQIKYIPVELTLAAMTLPVSRLSEKNFIANHTGDTTRDFEGANVGELIDFAEEHRYSFRRWGEAHVTILGAIEKLNRGAADQIEQIVAYMSDLRKGVLDVWNPPGVKPGTSTPPNDKPKPSNSDILPISGVTSHALCLKAKGGYLACRADGRGVNECLPAEKGYRDCRADGKGFSHCVPAKSGYLPCRNDGYSYERCLTADSGYTDCRADSGGIDACVKAKSGYRQCREDGNSRDQCLLADRGYLDCRNDGNPATACIAARGPYKFCRDEGGTTSECLALGKGYQQCRENGYGRNECAKADEGYKDCFSGGGVF